MKNIAAELESKIRREYGSNAGFVANVILHQHSKPVRKLRGMMRLLQHGHTVTLGQFTIDVLIVDGYTQPWELLERYGHPYQTFDSNVKVFTGQV